MADAAPTSNLWSWLISLAPSLNTTISAVVGVAVGVSGYAGLQSIKPTTPLVLAAADAPRPTPIACAQELHDLDTKGSAIRADLAILRQLIDERLPAPAPRRAPSKVLFR